jgi:diaminopimelate decarboxylase
LVRSTPALVMGPHARSHDVLHPAARLPPVNDGDRLVIRRVGAYNQSGSTVHGAAQAAVLVGGGKQWSPYGDGVSVNDRAAVRDE